jgi:hypothetical protein
MKTPPNSADRFVDAIALVMVLGGIVLFGLARSTLIGIGNETRLAPPGTTAVAYADLLVARSNLGLWVVAIGIVIGVVAAVRHFLQSRSAGKV